MGGQSAQQQNQGTQVYYDPQKGQYYTVNRPQSNDSVGNTLFGNPLANAFFGLTGGSADMSNRNYLGQSLNASADRFTPRNIEPNYPDMAQLFPALDAGLAQNLQQSLLAPTDIQSSGAARFLAPSTSSKGK